MFQSHAITDPPFLQQLRAATRAEHAVVESSLEVLTSSTLTPRAYRSILERLYAFVAPIEDRITAVTGHLDLGLELHARRKVAWLEQDLRACGVGDPTLLPRCRTLPELSSHARCFGCLYVLEGSTLGGQIITRHVTATLGLTADTGARYFTGYGADTARMWHAFREALRAYARGPAIQAEVIAAARATFRTLNDACMAGTRDV